MSNCSFNLHRQLQYLGGVWCFCICIIIVLVRIHNSCPLISNMWPKYSLSSSLSRPLCTSARRHYALKNCSLFFFFSFFGAIELRCWLRVFELSKKKEEAALLFCLEGRFSTNHWSRIEQCLSVILRIMKSVFFLVFFSGAASSHLEDSANTRLLLHHSKCSFEMIPLLPGDHPLTE